MSLLLIQKLNIIAIVNNYIYDKIRSKSKMEILLTNLIPSRNSIYNKWDTFNYIIQCSTTKTKNRRNEIKRK